MGRKSSQCRWAVWLLSSNADNRNPCSRHSQSTKPTDRKLGLAIWCHQPLTVLSLLYATIKVNLQWGRVCLPFNRPSLRSFSDCFVGTQAVLPFWDASFFLLDLGLCTKKHSLCLTGRHSFETVKQILLLECLFLIGCVGSPVWLCSFSIPRTEFLVLCLDLTEG